jgi:hypothetical protein
VLRAVLDLADAATRGARWVRALLRVSEWITLPAVRRAVDGALAVALVVQVVARSGMAAAAPLEPAQLVQRLDGTSADQRSPTAQRWAQYTV